MNARDEFYRALGDDLTREGDKSVLYQYLKEEQEKRAAQGGGKDPGHARSYQLRIRYYRRLLKEGELSPEEYLKLLLEVLLQKPQFARRCGKPEKGMESERITGYVSRDPQPLLRELLKTALGKEKAEEKADFGKDMQALYEILGGGKGKSYQAVWGRLAEKGFWKEPYQKLMILTDTVLDVAAAYDIREFFFDTAVERDESYQSAKRQKASGGRKGSTRAERTDKSLKLIDYYCRKKGKTLFGTGAGGKEPSDKECDALYRCLLKEGNEEVFVPLLVDSMTGCGICLIGRAYFEGEYPGERKRFQKIEQSCAYGVLFFDNDHGEDIRSGYHISNEFGKFRDYNSARFEGDWSYEKVRQEAEDTMKEANGRLPDGVSDIFQQYFEADEQPELEQARQEVRRQTAECEKEIRAELSRKNT